MRAKNPLTLHLCCCSKPRHEPWLQCRGSFGTTAALHNGDFPWHPQGISRGRRSCQQKAGLKPNPESGTSFWRWSVVTCCAGAAAVPLEHTSASTAPKEAVHSGEEGLYVPPRYRQQGGGPTMKRAILEVRFPRQEWSRRRPVF